MKFYVSVKSCRRLLGDKCSLAWSLRLLFEYFFFFNLWSFYLFRLLLSWRKIRWRWKCIWFVPCKVIFQLSQIYYWKEYALTVSASTAGFKAKYTESCSLLKPFYIICPFIYCVRLGMCIALMKVKSGLGPILFEVKILRISCTTVWLMCNLQNGAKPAQKIEILTCVISFMPVILSCTWMLGLFYFSNGICCTCFVMLVLTHMENLSNLSPKSK